jgi:hypothetical protein
MPSVRLSSEVRPVDHDLYAWQSPGDLDPDRAAAVLDAWRASGGAFAEAPFEPSTDVGWFYRELMDDAPGLDAESDAVPRHSKAPIWLATTDEAPARLVGIRVSPDTPPDTLEAIFGLAAKYDLVLFDARSRRMARPLEAMAEHASATFWPGGAIQAAVAGGIGGAIAVVAWILSIPVVSGILVVVGGFMAVMAVFTFVHEGRKRLAGRRARDTPPDG